MDRYVCTICGYVYDPEQGDPDSGVAAGTKWEDVPDDWECPVCGASKADFEKEQSIIRHLISGVLWLLKNVRYANVFSTAHYTAIPEFGKSLNYAVKIGTDALLCRRNIR